MGCPFLWLMRALSSALMFALALAFLPIHVLAYGFRPSGNGRNPGPAGRAPKRGL